jgi:Xaa-Pro aminopeptidase
MPPSEDTTVTDTERKFRIQQALTEANWDAVICALPSDVLLLTGYWPVIGASVAICFREGPTILLVPEDEREIAEKGFADSMVSFAAETLVDLRSITDAVKPHLTAALQHLHSGRGTIGVELAGSSQAASYLAIHLFGNNLADLAREALPHATLTPCEEWIRELQSVKTPFEIEKIRTACGIAGNSFEMGALRLRAGMDEREAAELFRAGLQSAKPARDFVRSGGFAFCMSGPNAAKACAAYARTRHRTLEPDDTVMIHCNSYVDGFWTDLTRTYTLQPPDERQHRMRTAIFAAREAALACIQPGARAADVDAALRRTVTNFGLADFLRHGTGHGVGFSPMSAYSIPQLHMKSLDILREGMVFNVEPAVYVDGYGGIRHCDMVVVTAAGYELLTHFQSDATALTLSCADSRQMQFAKTGAKS